MVLRLKTRESRSLPGLQNATMPINLLTSTDTDDQKGRACGLLLLQDTMRKTILTQKQAQRQTLRQSDSGAGWSSPVARQAHNLKAAGSNPAPATRSFPTITRFSANRASNAARSCRAHNLKGSARTGYTPEAVSRRNGSNFCTTTTVNAPQAMGLPSRISGAKANRPSPRRGRGEFSPRLPRRPGRQPPEHAVWQDRDFPSASTDLVTQIAEDMPAGTNRPNGWATKQTLPRQFI